MVRFERCEILGLAAVLVASVALWAPPAVAQSKGQCNSMQPLIGGHKAVVVNRTRTGDGSKPEFLSLTVFPGRAMNLFQVTAWIPGKGEIDLIHSPSIEEAARILCDANDPTGTKERLIRRSISGPVCKPDCWCCIRERGKGFVYFEGPLDDARCQLEGVRNRAPGPTRFMA